jgi:hypothetical protein
MGWERIPEDKPLEPGDIVRLTFSAPGPAFLKATEAAMIEATLANKEGYEMTSIDYLQPGKMIFKFKIVKTNPIIVTALVITGSIMLVGAAVGYMFVSAEQYTKALEKVIVPAGVLAISGMVLYMILGKK